MKHIFCGLLFFGILLAGFASPAAAKDRWIIGYTAITGIKAGLWVAEVEGIFDKYNIQP